MPRTAPRPCVTGTAARRARDTALNIPGLSWRPDGSVEDLSQAVPATRLCGAALCHHRGFAHRLRRERRGGSRRARAKNNEIGSVALAGCEAIRARAAQQRSQRMRHTTAASFSTILSSPGCPRIGRYPRRPARPHGDPTGSHASETSPEW